MGSVFGMIGIAKSVYSASKEKYTDNLRNLHNNNEIAKSIFGFLDKIDPTGISGLIGNLIKDACITEADIFDTTSN